MFRGGAYLGLWALLASCVSSADCSGRGLATVPRFCLHALFMLRGDGIPTC
jgi:hypothetical protein